jgi:hypothetical protein
METLIHSFIPAQRIKSFMRCKNNHRHLGTQVRQTCPPHCWDLQRNCEHTMSLLFSILGGMLKVPHAHTPPAPFIDEETLCHEAPTPFFCLPGQRRLTSNSRLNVCTPFSSYGLCIIVTPAIFFVYHFSPTACPRGRSQRLARGAAMNLLCNFCYRHPCSTRP